MPADTIGGIVFCGMFFRLAGETPLLTLRAAKSKLNQLILLYERKQCLVRDFVWVVFD